MIKQISITLEQMENMGWIIQNIDRDATEFILNINTGNSKIHLFARDAETGDLYETKYPFDYVLTLEDLQYHEITPNTIGSWPSKLCIKEVETGKISWVFPGDIYEILDMLPCEIAVYSSLDELNSDLYSIKISG